MSETLPLLQHAPPPSQMVIRAVLTIVEHRATLRQILDVSARICGTTVAEITAPTRGNGATIKARMIYFYAASALTGRSLDQIAVACGGRHHTTALHGIQRVTAVPALFEPCLSLVITRLDGPIGPGGMPQPRHRKE